MFKRYAVRAASVFWDSARKFTSLASNGYEFEMEMLASLEKGVIQEVPISTVYEIGNPTSHFSPIIDSTKILFVLLRFTSGSVFCAALDILLFALATYIFNSIAFAFFVARLTSLLVYFFINKEYVFTDHKKPLFDIPLFDSRNAIGLFNNTCN